MGTTFDSIASPSLENWMPRAWGVLALRGIVDILFGILAFVAPFPTLRALILLFAAYAFVDGIFSLIAGFRSASERRHWWPFILKGVLGIVVGIATVFAPGITTLALVTLIAAWAIVTGVLEIVAAVRLRQAIRGEWLLALAGLVSVLFGVLIFLFPAAGALTLVTVIGAYALLFGIVLIALGFRIRHAANNLAPNVERRSGGMRQAT